MSHVNDYYSDINYNDDYDDDYDDDYEGGCIIPELTAEQRAKLDAEIKAEADEKVRCISLAKSKGYKPCECYGGPFYLMTTATLQNMVFDHSSKIQTCNQCNLIGIEPIMEYMNSKK